MRINHNIAALNTYRQLSNNSAIGGKSLEKLSSGLRINRAGDDAAGLAISEKMRGQIRGLEQASRNAQDGISMIQTAEGALNETHSILQRMRELAVQSSNDTSTDADRAEMQKEITQLKSEIDRISSTTEFNTKKLLDGSLEKAGIAKATKLESIALDGTTTNGTSTSNLTIAATTTISTGVNDKLNINVDGGGATAVTIAQGQYSRTELVQALNDAIGNTSLAGTVTAELTSDNKIQLISATTGSSSSVAVTVADAARDASHALGFHDGTTHVAQASQTQTVTDKVIADTNNIVLSLDSGAVGGAQSYTVTFADLGYANGATFGDTAGDAAKLQAAFDANFGEGAVTVTGNGANLTFSSSYGTASIGAGTSGATIGATAGGTAYTGHAFNAGSAVSGATAEDIATGDTRLVALGDGSDNNLGLKSGNQINISVIVGGVEKTGTLAVTGSTDFDDLASAVQDVIGGSSVVTVDDTTGKLNITGQLGEANAVSNLKLTAQASASDTTAITGNFADKLSAYQETQAAEDSKVDQSLSFHIGANQSQTMNVDINEMSVQSLSLSSVDVSSQAGAETAITVINNAIENVSTERSKLGAFQNRLEHSINNLGTSAENLTAAESRIRDVDMAKEMMEFTKNNILSQAAQAMLAQANQQPQGVLQLLR